MNEYEVFEYIQTAIIGLSDSPLPISPRHILYVKKKSNENGNSIGFALFTFGRKTKNLLDFTQDEKEFKLPEAIIKNRTKRIGYRDVREIEGINVEDYIEAGKNYINALDNAKQFGERHFDFLEKAE